MVLDREIQTYEERKEELLAHEGKYVVIHGEEIGGFYDTLDEALEAGYERFGLDPILVKQIEREERVYWIPG